MTVKFPPLPGDWTQARVDRVATVNARIGWKALTADEYQAEGCIFLSTPNIKGRDIDYQNVNYITEERYEESPELKLAPEDVLLAKDGNTLGIVNIVKDLPRPATVNGSIAVIRSSKINPDFLKYVLASQVTQAAIDMLKGGMGVPHLFQWDINRLPLPMPPVGEQRRIAEFLDAKIGRIDRLLELRSHQINAVSSRTTSRISEIYSDLISRYGEIRLRHIITRIEQGWSPQCDDRPAGDGEWGVVKAGCVNTGIFDPRQHKALPSGVKPRREYLLRPGDLLMSRASGSPDLIGSVGIVGDHTENLLLCDKIYRLRLEESRSRTEFVAHMLRSHQVREHIKNGISGADGMANNLPTSVAKNCVIPNVPINLQNQIAHDFKCTAEKNRRIRSLFERSKILLTEHRQALITAAVTGQFDVSSASGRGAEA